MPITEFLDGRNFDRETRRVMGIAYEMACAALKFESRTYVVHETIAKRIIALAKDGLVDPNRLCDQALIGLHNEIRCVRRQSPELFGTVERSEEREAVRQFLDNGAAPRRDSCSFSDQAGGQPQAQSGPAGAAN